MIKRALIVLCISIVVVMPKAGLAQAPSPETLATARELIATAKAAENLKLILPSVVQALKPAVVQGRPEVERDFDVFVPLLLKDFSAQLNELIEQVAVIYASNFTVAEMKEMIAFYHSPTGQKFLALSPVIMQRSMLAGQQFGSRVGRELQVRIIEEMKKRGHKI